MSDLRREVEEQMERGNASKRAREVARIIMERGVCSTGDLEELGYKHPPRAVCDLRDAGLEIERGMEAYIDPVTGKKKRRGTYRIVGTDPTKKSRRRLTKKFSGEVKSPGRCEVCGADGRLQADHRIPFEIGGETHPHILAEFMPLCPSCNRGKSWECENCANWTARDVDVCRGCMWASPDTYEHVAGKQERRAAVTLDDPAMVEAWDALRPDVKTILEGWLREKR